MLKKKLLAFIPARGGSKRFPKKNIAKFLNKPLISYPITEAIKSKLFETVIVSSDNKDIKNIATKYGAKTVNRSKKNSSNTAHELEACREYFSSLIKKGSILPDYFCIIYPTAVLLKAVDFKKSFNLMQENKDIDVVMGVSRFNYHPYKALAKNKKGLLKTIFKVESNLRSQNYRDMFASNGTLYWHNTKSFLDKKYFGHYANKLIGYIIESKIPMDIDYKEDLDNLNAFFKLGRR
jgi:pseudaminic acid cytidylyltransferase